MFSNPQLVRFCNQTIRPLADDVTRLARDVTGLIAVVQAQGLLPILLAADQTAIIDDGSTQDGRPPMTVSQLVAFLAECQKVHSAIDTTTAVQQALAIQVNGLL